MAAAGQRRPRRQPDPGCDRSPATGSVQRALSSHELLAPADEGSVPRLVRQAATAPSGRPAPPLDPPQPRPSRPPRRPGRDAGQSRAKAAAASAAAKRDRPRSQFTVEAAERRVDRDERPPADRRRRNRFPASAPLFKLVALGKKGIRIGVFSGSFTSGDPTLLLTKGHKITLANQSDGSHYVLKLVRLTTARRRRQRRNHRGGSAGRYAGDDHAGDNDTCDDHAGDEHHAGDDALGLTRTPLKAPGRFADGRRGDLRLQRDQRGGPRVRRHADRGRPRGRARAASPARPAGRAHRRRSSTRAAPEAPPRRSSRASSRSRSRSSRASSRR